jgi:nicotinamidase-related amidase
MGRILIAGEPGAEIVPELAPAPGETGDRQARQGRLLRHRVGRSSGPLGDRAALIFAGVTTEVCVQTTMREANDRGFECLLAEDATESYFPDFKAATLAMIRAQGAIVGWTARVDEIARGARWLSR